MAKKRKKRRRSAVRGRKKMSEFQQRKLMGRMAREHPGVLQNIEFVVVQHHQEHDGIDDRTAFRALRAALNGIEPTNESENSVAKSLQTFREFRSDVSDDVWEDALLVVMQSVPRHSDLTPGATDYLEFISEFIV